MPESRRDFIKHSALVGSTAAFAASCQTFSRLAEAGTTSSTREVFDYHANDPENIIYSTCLNCHAACPIKCKLVRPDDKSAVLVKIDGNPYSAQAAFPNVTYATPPNAKGKLAGTSTVVDVAKTEGRICPKGHGGIEVLYDPYRLRKVLKRAGRRGEGKWEAMPFEQAIKEISHGAKFADGTTTPGLDSMYALRPEMKGPDGSPLTKEVAEAVKDINKAIASAPLDQKTVTRDQMVAEFKEKFAAHLDVLLDPDHPDLGPRNNRFVFLAGRIEHGRKELMKAWTNNSFGSINAFEHTTICEQSHHIAFEQVTNLYNPVKKLFWAKGKHHMKPDLENARFVVFFGTGCYEANFGPPILAGLQTHGATENAMKWAVVDPRLSKTAAWADRWIPIQPGGDGALAMGMLRWIIESKRYDASFLSHANAAAAKAGGESAYTTATYLVKLEDGRPTKYLRASEVAGEDDTPLGDEHTFVVVADGKLTAVQMEAGEPLVGELEPSLPAVAIGGENVRVRTAFQLLKARVTEKTLEEYATEAGLDEDGLGGAKTVAELAREFTSYGKQAVAEFYRGPVQHTNGYYQAHAIILLNVLIGNSGWKGGWSVGGSHYHEMGGKDANVYDVAKLYGGKLAAFGTRVTRERAEYEASMLFNGKHGNENPGMRPWYPFTSNLYQEVIPAAGAEYPYGIGCLFLHKGTPVLACPAGHKQIAILRDHKKIPLFVACDIVVGETSMYADYIIPDTAVWERWGTPHVTPALLPTISKVRQPVVEPLTDVVTVFGEKMHISMEAFLMAVAEELGLSGVGPKAYDDGGDFTRPEDWFLRLIANIALGDKVSEGRLSDAAPKASDDEVQLFVRSRRHLSDAVFNFERWKRAVGPAGRTKKGLAVSPEELWGRVISMLNRGGNFMDWHRRYSGNVQQHPYKNNFNIFVEPVANTRDSMTGEFYDGLPRLEPVKDAKGNVIDDRSAGYTFLLGTYKDILAGHTRTMPPARWLMELFGPPERGNVVLVNSRDAERLGLKEGDEVRIASATLADGKFELGDGRTMECRAPVRVLEGIRPGTCTVSWHFGHWAYGSNSIEIDGQKVPADRRRGKGICPNPLFREDTSIGNVCLTDPIGGSASFYDTRVKLTRA